MQSSFTVRLPVTGIKETSLRGTSLCKLCDIEDWSDSEFSALSGDILHKDPTTTIHHRKLWEFVQCIRVLQHSGVYTSQSFGISVAAGHERLLYYLANNVERIVAADIYGVGDFAGHEAARSFFDSPESFAPYPYRQDALRVVRLAAHNLVFPEDAFDFAVCLSSIEHFGGMLQARRAISEMLRVIRPGGIVFITTDCSLNRLTTNEIFRATKLPSLWEGLPCTLLEPLNFSVSERSLEHVVDMHSGDLSELPHINLAIHGAVFTSVSIALVKNGPPRSPRSVVSSEDLDTLIASLRLRQLDFQESKPSWLRNKLRGLCYRLQVPFR